MCVLTCVFNVCILHVPDYTVCILDVCVLHVFYMFGLPLCVLPVCVLNGWFICVFTCA